MLRLPRKILFPPKDLKTGQSETLTTSSKVKRNTESKTFTCLFNFNHRHFSCKRQNIEAIASEIEGKSIEEVAAYSDVFWARYKELGESDKIIANIAKAEARLLKITEINAAIDQKIGQARVPLQQVKLVYGQNKGKTYTEEEDRFLVRLTSGDLFTNGSAKH